MAPGSHDESHGISCRWRANSLREIKALPVVGTLLAAGTMVLVVWRYRITSPAATRDGIFGNSDLFTEFYPMFEASSSRLRAGRLFLWNPHQLCGLPGLSTLQFGVLYPPHLLYLVVPVPAGMGILTFAHLLLGVISALVLGRVLALSWAAAWVVAMCFGLSSVTTMNALSPNALYTVAWLPLGIAAVVRILHGGRSGWVVALSVAVAMSILAGGYQYTVYNLYAFLLCAICGAGARAIKEKGVRLLGPIGLTLSLSVAVGAALAAPQLLPTLELTGEGARTTHALRLDQVLPFGKQFTWYSVLADAWIPSDDFFKAYVGVVPLLLASVGLLYRTTPAILFPALLVLWGVLGMVAPDWFIHARAWVPALAWFRLPFRAKSLGVLGLAMLAGMGFDTFKRALTSSCWLHGIVPAVLISGGLAAAAGRYPHQSWLIAAGLVLVGAIACWVRRPNGHLVLSTAMLVLCTADILMGAPNTFSVPWMGENWHRVWEHSAIWSETQQRAGLFRILNVPTGLAALDFSWQAKSATFDGAYSPLDYDPLALGRYGDFFEYAASGRAWPAERSSAFMGYLPPDFWSVSPARVRRFLSLLSVRYLLLPPPALRDASVVRFASAPQIVAVRAWGPNPRAPEAVLLENLDALPRAYVVPRAECIANPLDQLARLASPTFNPREAVVLEGQCASAAAVPGAIADVRIDDYEDTRVRIAVDSSQPGFLVLTDSYYPGWQAWINGRLEPILRANTVLRAVPVPAGHSNVEFRYRPRSFYVGAAIAVGTVGLTVLLWGRSKWPTRRPMRGTAADR